MHFTTCFEIQILCWMLSYCTDFFVWKFRLPHYYKCRVLKVRQLLVKSENRNYFNCLLEALIVVRGAGGPGFNSPVVLGGSFQIWELGSWLLVWVKYLGMWKLRKCVQFIFFSLKIQKKSGGFSKMRKRSQIFCNQLRIFRNLFLILLFMLT